MRWAVNECTLGARSGLRRAEGAVTAPLTPAATVLMPVHNGERFLREAVDSVLGQTMGDFEFLIIDDGSTDRGCEILRTYTDRRIRFEANPTREGIARTLNRGIRMAAGRYVVRMDCDDVSLPHRLSRLVSEMDNRPDLVVLGSWLETFGMIRQVWTFPSRHDAIRARMLFESSIAHASAILRRDFFLRADLAYDDNRPHAEDFDLWVRAGSMGRLANLPEVLYLYRHYEGQTVRRHSEQKARSADAVRAAQLRLLELDLTDADLALHSLLSTRQTEASWAALDAAESWLGRIAAANRERVVFDQTALEEEIAGRWTEACRRAASLGPRAWARHRRSLLRRRGTLRATDSARFLAKCLLWGVSGIGKRA